MGWAGPEDGKARSTATRHQAEEAG